MPSVGRKFLLAGRGGLNLTHSEDLERLLARYGAAAPTPARRRSRRFRPTALRAWCEALGQPTFVGIERPRVSQGHEDFAAAARVAARGSLRWASRSSCGIAGSAGTTQGRLRVRDARRRGVAIAADATVLALGGASWPRLGSDGAWVAIARAGRHRRSRRCSRPTAAFIVAWSDVFRDRFAGQPLKRLELSFGARKVRGEAIVTDSRPGRRRHLRPVGSAARGHRGRRRGDPAHRPAPRRDARRSGNSASPRRAPSSRCRPSCARPPTCRRRDRPAARGGNGHAAAG